METRASFVLVGAFVILLAISAVGFVFWMAGNYAQDERSRYNIAFSGAVSGLKPSSDVLYRGIPVGSVTDIAINPDNLEQVFVEVALEQTFPARSDMVATIDAQGITGLSVVQLTGGSDAGETIAPGGMISSKQSTLETVVASVPELIQQTSALLSSIDGILSDKRIEQIMQDLAELSMGLNGSLAKLDETLIQGNATLAQFDQTAQSLDENLGVLAKDASGFLDGTSETVENFNAVSVEFGRTARDLREIMANLDEPLEDFGNRGLYDMSQLITEMRGVVAITKRIATEFERDPAGFLLGGNSSKGFIAR